MNLNYFKIGISLILIGGILGIINSIWMLLTPADFFAPIIALFAPNTLLIWLGYASLIALIIIIILALVLLFKQLLTQIKMILILVIILGIVELMNISYPYLAIIGGLLVVIGALLAWFSLKPVPAAKPAKPVKKAVRVAKPAKVAKAKKIEMKIVDIEKIEGIGEVYTEKFKAIGIKTTKDLLEAGQTPSGREELANKTDLSAKLILEWVQDSDLMRIKGVSEEYSDLLEESEVRDVPELATKDPASLYKKLLEVNAEKKIVRKTPLRNDVRNWIEQAKKLPKMIEY